jgi:hypothetical protein
MYPSNIRININSSNFRVNKTNLKTSTRTSHSGRIPLAILCPGWDRGCRCGCARLAVGDCAKDGALEGAEAVVCVAGTFLEGVEFRCGSLHGVGEDEGGEEEGYREEEFEKHFGRFQFDSS